MPIVIALCEALVNVLIHRDYFDNTQARMRIFNDRIETYNAGAAPKTVEEIIDNEATAPRNPLIAKLFRMVGFAETAGSGMPKIFNAWKQLNYKPPVIDNSIANYSFKMTFPLVKKASRVKSAPRNDQVVTKLKPGSDQVAEKLGIDITRLESILSCCFKPKNILEIMEFLKLKHRTNFRNRLINPLLNEKLIKMEDPDSPNSPNQKYVTTDKGRKMFERK